MGRTEARVPLLSALARSVGTHLSVATPTFDVEVWDHGEPICVATMRSSDHYREARMGGR